MMQILEEMINCLVAGESFVLATVITRNGSAPRAVGAKMLVREDGKSVGTIGGGILEAQVLHLAKQVHKEHTAVIRGYSFDGRDAADMDAICGGQVEVLVEWVDGRERGMEEIVRGWKRAVQENQKAWLITTLPAGEELPRHMFILLDGTVMGNGLPDMDLGIVMDIHMPCRLALAGYQAMIEPININGTAYIFGAGHVSRSLAEFVKAVGFWTVVVDNRAEYANTERFPGVAQVVALDSFSDLLEKFHFDTDSYIVIVTRGHLDDLTVLAQVLKTPAAYIGMIGSRRKCALIFDELRRMGYAEEDIQRVHAPIGIPIGAETPEEIGISIVAEMICVRAKLRG